MTKHVVIDSTRFKISVVFNINFIPKLSHYVFFMTIGGRDETDNGDSDPPPAYTQHVS